MNKPLIRSLMIACVASMTLPAQGVMVARKKAQDPKPTADAPKSKAQAKVDVKALHEKLMKALEQADLSDAERAKVMETLAKALHQPKAGVTEVAGSDVFVVGRDGQHQVKVLDVNGKPVHGVVVVQGSENGEHGVDLLHDLPLLGELFEKRIAKARKVDGAPEGLTYRFDVETEETPAGEPGSQFRVKIVSEAGGEEAVAIAEQVCEEGEAPKVRWLRSSSKGEPIAVEMADIEIAEPMLLKLQDLELKLDQQHNAGDVQRKKAGDLRARAEKLRAAVVQADPDASGDHDVRVYVRELAKAADGTKDVKVEVEKLRKAMAGAHEGHGVWVVGGDEGPAIFEWKGEAPKAKAKGKTGGKGKGRAKSEQADGDTAAMIRELREEMRELRQMMKQIRKEMRDGDEDEAPMAPAAPPTPAAFPTPTPAAAPAFGALPRVAPARVRAAGGFGGFPAAGVGPAAANPAVVEHRRQPR